MTAAESSATHYTGPPFDEARVHDAMRVGVITCRPETDLHDVARMMVTYKVHSVVVQDVGTGSRPWGIITSLDIAAESSAGLDGRTAGEAATTELVTVAANETLAHAAKLMTEHGVTHLIVVEPATDWPCGILSARDLAAALTAPSSSILKQYGASAVARGG